MDGSRIDESDYVKMVQLCGKELIDYINRTNCARITQHNRELEKLNPRVKRSIYGPFPPYFMPTTTVHSLKYFGFPDDDVLSDEYYSGFAVFEDYPFSCSYQTYRGAFAAMTLLLYLPRLTLYPELYVGSRGGCIDGAVKYAHAPMGNYSCPPYQNATLAMEYVYNTAYKTEDGFGYWNTYGFHRALCDCDYINEFVHDWHYVAEHKPERPLRSIAYIIDYSGDEDFYRPECNYYNQSESGQTVLYECARESGVPNGFGIKPQALGTLTENDCDVLVLPSLAHADKAYIAEIRRLYAAGVNLIALSDVTGLEDIFGVEKCATEATVMSVEYDGTTEYVYNTAAHFAYTPTHSHVTVTANRTLPAVISTDRTLLVNTALLSLGCADKKKGVSTKGAFIVGSLIRKALTAEVVRLSTPVAFGENVGVTAFTDTHGNRMLLAIQYTPFDNGTHDTTEAVIQLHMDDVTDVSADIPVMVGKSGGIVREIRFAIQPHGFAFIKCEVK